MTNYINFIFLVPHIRPEERLMAAQQHQLLQAANAQHMAAMVALEAMQNQAKVSKPINKCLYHMSQIILIKLYWSYHMNHSIYKI